MLWPRTIFPLASDDTGQCTLILCFIQSNFKIGTASRQLCLTMSGVDRQLWMAQSLTAPRVAECIQVTTTTTRRIVMAIDCLQ